MAKQIKWKAKEHKNSERGANFFWVSGAFSLFIILYLFFLQEYSSAAAFFMFTIVIFLISKKEPKALTYIINKKSFILDNNQTIIDYEDVYSYNTDEENLKILINTKKAIEPVIIVPVRNKQGLEKIDDFLLDYIRKDSDLKVPILHYLILKIMGMY